MNCHTPAYFPQRKLVRDENIILEQSFWKMFFATRDIREVEEFWLTYFIMTTNMKDYFLEEKEEGVRQVFRETMERQFEHDLYNKSFSNQIESDETDTLQQRIKWWMMVVDKRGPMPNIVYGYTFGELFGLYRKAIHPEMQDFVKELRGRHNIPLKKQV